MIKNRKLSDAPYGTHITPLIAAVLETEGDVIELGMGDYSTPLLHEIVKYQRSVGINRNLFSYENHREWLNNFIDLENAYHHITFVNKWENISLIKCSVVFIDHAPAERRIIDIERWRHHADIIVVHDTDKLKYYGYEPILSSFKYRNTYERYAKSTTIVSDRININNVI